MFAKVNEYEMCFHGTYCFLDVKIEEKITPNAFA